MDSKREALRLYDKFGTAHVANEVVDEIIMALNDLDSDDNDNVMENINMEERFWNDVKKEIDEL